MAFTIDLNRSNHERLYKVSEGVQYIHQAATDGAIAEFGIASGETFEVIAATLSLVDQIGMKRGIIPRNLYAFDSFEGMPPAVAPEDTESPMLKQTNLWRPGNCHSPGVEKIKSLAVKFIPEVRVKMYPGWFKDTLPTVPKEVKFGFCHIDCDFYQSSLEVLDFLLQDRLTDGAVLMFDDFLENRGSPKFGQRKAWIDCLAKYNPTFTDLGFYALSGWRCIIHR